MSPWEPPSRSQEHALAEAVRLGWVACAAYPDLEDDLDSPALDLALVECSAQYGRQRVAVERAVRLYRGLGVDEDECALLSSLAWVMTSLPGEPPEELLIAIAARLVTCRGGPGRKGEKGEPWIPAIERGVTSVDPARFRTLRKRIDRHAAAWVARVEIGTRAAANIPLENLEVLGRARCRQLRKKLDFYPPPHPPRIASASRSPPRGRDAT